MRSWKRLLLVTLVLLTILSLLLSACGLVEKSHGDSNDGKDKDKTQGHGPDKEKEKGIDKGKDKGATSNKILICHKTGSIKKPFVQISVVSDAIKDGHARHAADIIPSPKEGCPTK